ncbi:MAG TPA: hypothetical protein VKW08_18480 [Xanthobacteraceae bacterium]|nr:hypothetical protein [Xanthobacteraceae bacterium]
MNHLHIDPQLFDRSFGREPFGFTHDLSNLELFDFDSLRALAAKYPSTERDVYAFRGAPAPGSDLAIVSSLPYSPLETLRRLDEGDCRLLLMRPEKYDQRFRILLDELFQQVIRLAGGLGRDAVLRLEATILVSSGATITPFHFDPETAFFCHISGEKEYHVYSPTAMSEADLEPFYSRAKVTSGHVPLNGRDPGKEHVFNLTAGRGHHQPQNAPHWVKTGKSPSVSYSFVFETTSTRLLSKVRGCNHYLRKLGLEPTPPGAHTRSDAIKAAIMDAAIPLRKALAKASSAFSPR